MHQIIPQTSLTLSSGWRDQLWREVEVNSWIPGVIAALIGLYLIFAVIAHCFDRTTVYRATEPPWLHFRGFGGLLLVNLRLYHSVVRIFYCAPGWTKLTHLQSVHLLVTKIFLSACGCIVFLGVRQCTPLQSLSAAAFSSVTSSLVIWVSRKLFMYANTEGEVGRAYKVHKHDRDHPLTQGIKTSLNLLADAAGWDLTKERSRSKKRGDAAKRRLSQSAPAGRSAKLDGKLHREHLSAGGGLIAPEQVEVKVEAFASNCRTTPGCLAHLGDRTTAPSNRPNRPTTKVRVPADALRVVDVKAAGPARQSITPRRALRDKFFPGAAPPARYGRAPELEFTLPGRGGASPRVTPPSNEAAALTENSVDDEEKQAVRPHHVAGPPFRPFASGRRWVVATVDAEAVRGVGGSGARGSAKIRQISAAAAPRGARKWHALKPCRTSYLLLLAWLVNGLLLLVGACWLVSAILMLRAKKVGREITPEQDALLDEYWANLWRAFGLATVTWLFVQDPIKVFLAAVISPTIMPNILDHGRAKYARRCLRMLISLLRAAL
jgi:hypothetical protein